MSDLNFSGGTSSSGGGGFYPSIKIDIRFEDTDAIRKLKQALSKEEIAKATNRAINRSLEQARTQISTLMRNKYKMPAFLVTKDTLKIVRSTRSSLTGFIAAKASPESLAHFPLKAYQGQEQTASRLTSKKDNKGRRQYMVKARTLKNTTDRKGVFIEVVKGRKQNITSAFLVFNNGRPLVMARGEYKGSQGFKRGKPRLPITKLNTKSVFWGSLYPKQVSIWMPFTQEAYAKALTHELEQGINFGK